MKFLKLFEKRIAQLRSDITITYSLDIYTTTHSFGRQGGRDIKGYDNRPVSNAEIEELVRYFRILIAEKIDNGEIEHDVDFIIKSKSKMLSAVLIPKFKGEFWWMLSVKTVFRESEKFSLRTGQNQIVITDDDI